MASRTETREIFLSTPAGKKNFERSPRAPECTDRARTSPSVSARASRVDYLVFFPKALVRRDMFETLRKFHDYNYYHTAVVFTTSEGAVDDRDVAVYGNVVVLADVTLVNVQGLESVVTGQALNSGPENKPHDIYT